MEIAIVGGGYAGVVLARKLASRIPPTAHVYLIDDTGTHELQHEIHRVVRDPAIADDIAFDLKGLLDETTVVDATVTGVDPETPRITCADGKTFDPTYLVLCLGAVPATQQVPGAAEHALSLKSIADAQQIRYAVSDLGPGARIAVVGAGLSGVQLAGELAAVNTDLEVTLYEEEETVAPTFPGPFQRAVRQHLDRAGVHVNTGTRVREVDSDELRFHDGAPGPFALCLWTGGLAPSPAIGERPKVYADLRWDAQTFVLGDAAKVIDRLGRPVPASARTAIEQAEVCATNLGRLAAGPDQLNFEPRLRQYEMGTATWAVSIGDESVAMVEGTVLTGRAAQMVKTAATARYLASIGRRLEAFQIAKHERPRIRSTSGRSRGRRTRCWRPFDA